MLTAALPGMALKIVKFAGPISRPSMVVTPLFRRASGTHWLFTQPWPHYPKVLLVGCYVVLYYSPMFLPFLSWT